METGKIKEKKMKMRRLFAPLIAALSLCSVSYALSPFQTVAGVGGPMPGVSLGCTTMIVSTVTATSVILANSSRESLYVVNSSTVNVAGGNYPPVVFISTFAASGGTGFDYSTLNAIPVFPTEYGVLTATTTVPLGPQSFQMNGGSIYQGPIYVIGNSMSINSIPPRVTACELNP